MPDHDITQILEAVGNGEAGAVDRLLEAVYADLHDIGERQLAKERKSHTLQPTVLVHDAYMRLIAQDRADWKNRAQFYAVAARVIRRILVDHARMHRRQKRQHDRAPLTTIPYEDNSSIDLLALDEALEKLAKIDEVAARVVEMRFFAEQTNDEIAHVLEVNERTVRRHWTFAKAWLHRELHQDE